MAPRKLSTWTYSRSAALAFTGSAPGLALAIIRFCFLFSEWGIKISNQFHVIGNFNLHFVR